MAVYTVPQDVEAEDKLLGPFNFRQFIYLMIAAGCGVAMFFLSRINIFVAAIPLPVFIVFAVLALPLRKDQPMETYLAALIRFYLKPHKRFWEPDGTASLIEITNPIIDKGPELKEVSGQEAAQRLSFLSQVVDSQGWSTRGVSGPTSGTSLRDDVVDDATEMLDVLDDTGALARAFSQRISQFDENQRNEVLQRMQEAIVATQPQQPQQISRPAPRPTPQQPITQPSQSVSQTIPPQPVDYSQYSTQYSPLPNPASTAVTSPVAVSQPIQPPIPQNPAPEPATEITSPDIIRLANNNDLSVAAVEREATRLSDKDDGEIVVNLR